MPIGRIPETGLVAYKRTCFHAAVSLNGRAAGLHFDHCVNDSLIEKRVPSSRS